MQYANHVDAVQFGNTTMYLFDYAIATTFILLCGCDVLLVSVRPLKRMQNPSSKLLISFTLILAAT